MSKFTSDIGGMFYDLIRAAGMTMVPIDALAKVQERGAKIGKAIEAEARVQSVKVIKQLQEAVVDAFKALESDHSKLEARVDELEIKVQALSRKKSV